MRANIFPSKASERARFPRKAFRKLRIGCEFRRENLECHEPVERRLPRLIPFSK
jgi:hypothetical protein